VEEVSILTILGSFDNILSLCFPEYDFISAKKAAVSKIKPNSPTSLKATGKSTSSIESSSTTLDPKRSIGIDKRKKGKHRRSKSKSTTSSSFSMNDVRPKALSEVLGIPPRNVIFDAYFAFQNVFCASRHRCSFPE
jgi:hypothetical protein